MHTHTFTSLAHLSDAELLARVATLAAREREATALLVAHLAELDLRGPHLHAGYGSLFAYCREALALSEHEAYNRIEVARAARRFPVILDKLADGSLNLTAARLLAPHLTAENHREVLESARARRKHEVEGIVARLQPRPDVPASVRTLPAPPLTPPAAEAPIPTTAAPAEAPGPIRPQSLPPPPPGPPSRSLLPPGRPVPPEPLSPGRYRLQLTIGEGWRSCGWRRTCSATRSLRATRPRSWTAPSRRCWPTWRRRSTPPPGSRHIPAAVKRAVWQRDAGRCAFVGAGGRRCTERAFLEYHHVHPFAAGGPATVENVQLRCFRHNHYEARLYFGEVREHGVPYDARSQVMLEATRSGTSRRARSSGRSSSAVGRERLRLAQRPEGINPRRPPGRREAREQGHDAG